MANRVTTRCRLELDTSQLPAATPVTPALHDSYRWYYRLLSLPQTRYIDGGLGRFGTRDPFRLTAETLHPSVDAWCQQYASGPMPVVDRPYAPANVGDYETRKKASLKATAHATANYPRDVR